MGDGVSDALANEIVDSLSEVGITKPSLLASTCMDGQYFAVGVPGKLVQLLHEKGGDSGESQSSVSALCGASLWSAAHLLNLAEKDVRLKFGEHKWIQDTIEKMTAISSRYISSKRFEELMDQDHGLLHWSFNTKLIKFRQF